MISLAQKLSESQKRVIILLLLVFILVFVLIGAIATLIKNIMDHQGSKADEMLHNVVKVEYFNKESKLIKFGIRKNIRQFYKEARIAFLILLVSWVAFVLYELFSGDWHYNPLKEFGTILFHFGEWPKNKFFGMNLICGWPPVIEKPHFEWHSFFSYLFIPANVVGIGWFLYDTQAYISRSIRIRKIAKGIFRKKLVPDKDPTSYTEQPK